MYNAHLSLKLWAADGSYDLGFSFPIYIQFYACKCEIEAVAELYKNNIYRLDHLDKP